MLGMLGKIFEKNLSLPEIVLHAAGTIKQSRFAGEAQTIDTGENKEDQRPKAR